MTHRIQVQTRVKTGRRVEVETPEFPEGELVDVSIKGSDGSSQTLADLLNSEIIGIWRDRDDIDDSAEFARELRESAWKRSS